MLFDSHAHINNDTFTEEEREALIADIEASDLSYVMDIGFDLPSSERAAEDAQRLPWCYAAVGVHPHDAKTMDEDVLLMIKELAGEEKVKLASTFTITNRRRRTKDTGSAARFSLPTS